MGNQVLIESRGDLIIVTHPGTDFSATYGKAEAHPGLLLLAATTDAKSEPEKIYQFRADAFAGATQKARELGWIV